MLFGLLLASTALRSEEHQHIDGFRLISFAMPDVPDSTELEIPDGSADPDAAKYLNRGYELLLSGATEEASLYFRSAYRLDPDCVFAYWGMAYCWLDDPVTARLHANAGVIRARRADVPEWQSQWINELQRALRGARREEGPSEKTRGKILTALEQLALGSEQTALAEALYMKMSLEGNEVGEGSRLPYLRMVENLGNRSPELPLDYVAQLTHPNRATSAPAGESLAVLDLQARAETHSLRWQAAATTKMQALEALLRLRERYQLPFDGDPKVAARIRDLLEISAKGGNQQDVQVAEDFIANFPRRIPLHANEKDSIATILATWDKDEPALLAAATADSEAPKLERTSSRVIRPGRAQSERAPHLRSPDYRFTPAPSWSAKNDQGNRMSSDGMKGQAYVAVFYLGEGCIHCMEQLQSLMPFSEQFEEAGIKLLAFSTDTQENLNLTTANLTEADALPFSLLADPELTAFREFGAYNDFTDEPLHGIFLVDARGRQLWWEIGPHPYEEIAHLLEESKRLLARSAEIPTTKERLTPTAQRIPVGSPSAGMSKVIE